MTTGQLETVPRAVPVRATSTWGEDLACALAALWLATGLYLDGWAHTHQPELETFFTPWHGVLYSGFAVLAAVVAAAAWRRRQAGGPPRGRVPAGYGLGLLGAGVFLSAGLADLAWHEILGIEVDLEALLSPPHLALLTGGMLLVTTPLRATVARTGGLPASPRDSLPVILCLAAATSIAAFFLSYLSAFDDLPLVSVHPTNWQALGLANHLVTTAVFGVPVLLGYARGGRIPPGLITAVVAATALPVGVFGDFAYLPVQLGAVAGGVAADVAVQLVTGSARRWAPLVTGVTVPALVWTGYLVGAAATVGIRWSLPLWSGMVVLTLLVGAVLGGLMVNRAPAP